MDAAERDRLEARAAALEEALARYRDWRAKQTAKEAQLLDALKAHRAYLAKGIDRAYRLSAELSGIRLRLHEAQRAGEAPRAGEAARGP